MRTLTLEKLQENAARKRAELGLGGNDDAPVNSGQFRTPEKRNLLRAVDKAAKASRRTKPFQANY